MSRRMRVLAVLIAACIPLAAGCGDSGSKKSERPTTTTTRPTTTSRPPAKTVTIGEVDFRLSPARVKVSKPGTYVFHVINHGPSIHAFEIEGHGLEAKSPAIDVGTSARVRVTLKRGRYEMYCPIDGHRDSGMEGTVTVGGAGTTAAGGASGTGGATGSTGGGGDENGGGYGP